MAIREYVGARYVPRFTGLYDATQVYDALDVVDNGSGTSYIAKKTVPAGTPLTNTDYWFVYGASSGAIINLQNQINTLDDQVGLLTGLRGRNVILITDSYGDVQNEQFPKIMAAKLGKTVNNGFYYNSTGGSGFVNGVTFLSQLQSLILGGAFDPDDISDIVVVGGVNDGSYTYADIYSAVNDFCTYVKTTFPNAICHVGFISKSTTVGAIYAMLHNVVKAYYDGAMGAVNATYIKGVENLLDNTMIDSDNIHPTLAGCNFLGWCIGEYVLNGSLPIQPDHKTLYYETEAPLGTGSSVTISFDKTSNGDWYVTSPQINCAFPAATSAIYFASGAKLMKLSAGDNLLLSPSYQIGCCDVDVSFKCLDFLGAGQHAWINAQGKLKFAADGIYLKALPSYEFAVTQNGYISQFAIWQGLDQRIEPFYA